MGLNLTRKIITKHLVSGDMVPGKEIGLAIDQTLLQDATGTMACQELEALGVERIQSKLAVIYVDHNMLQTGFENADDHRYLQGIAAKYGAIFSKPGNGISHQAHMERLGIPGQTLLGADSHTPHAGGIGMLGIGAGGLEVAAAMAGEPFNVAVPKVVLVHLTGKLSPWVSAKDVILEILRHMTVKGAVGKVLEYGGPAVATLTVPQRGTICNMGAEVGATSSIFPSDEQTRRFLRAQKREEAWHPLEADANSEYDEVLELDLSSLEPLIALPSSPDNVVPVREVEGTPVAQVAVGSSVNSSYVDLMTIASVLKEKKIHPGISVVASPGSRQVLLMTLQSGGLASLIKAGVRELEVACGPCIGMGQAPPTHGNSIRTFNRNFKGRSGTADDQVYLTSPEVAAATAIYGVITDPRKLGTPPKIEMPEEFLVDDSMFIPPAENPREVEIIRGPNIKPLPLPDPLPDRLAAGVVIKVEDNISTDHILPGGNEVLPLRSNIPAISEHTFKYVDEDFPRRAREMGGGFIVGGHNYGQGSSREHAAIAPMYLGIKAVLAKSFARIHSSNLVNFGVLPLTFSNERDYDSIEQGDTLEIRDIHQALDRGEDLKAVNTTRNRVYSLSYSLSPRQIQVLLSGGLIKYIRQTKGLDS